MQGGGKTYAWHPGGRQAPVPLTREDIDELHGVAQLMDKHLPGWKRKYAIPLPPPKGAGQ